ncbi:MAG: aminotransferase class I/II-fold pyridoxal phosphate-dependent enzyme [Clostridiales bacterium]|nr:aminotransferase class I/II-fold pyridoxal phosphate-dependent enzyme [Clostridiales bacterium]
MISFYPDPEADVAEAVQDAARRGLFSDGHYSRAVEALFAGELGARNLLLTPSCTAALIMACRLLRLRPGDEVVVPSYNFPAAANAVLLGGGTPVFADVDPRTQNLSVPDAASRVTGRTRAIVAVHYASVACDMDGLSDLCARESLDLIEDAAQAVAATYKGRYLGAIGRFGCYSFHATKVFSSGEGGALHFADEDAPAASVYRDNGTDREAFLRGERRNYAWRGLGESARMGELPAAALHPQLLRRAETIERRLGVHRAYDRAFRETAQRGLLTPMRVPEECGINGHIYYVRFARGEDMERARAALLSEGIPAMTHYVPLHLSPMGRSLGYRPNDLPESRRAYETLLRLPIHERMTGDDALFVAERLLKAVGG